MVGKRLAAIRDAWNGSSIWLRFAFVVAVALLVLECRIHQRRAARLAHEQAKTTVTPIGAIDSER